jgi:hypothetical protein
MPKITDRVALRLLAAAAMLCVALWAAPSWGQSTDNPTTGRGLFLDTPTNSGINTLTASCMNCHTVQDRRTKIGGSVFADISFNSAMTRLTQAIGAQPAMRQFGALDVQQVRDLAAYIADTPEASTAELDFTASAINTDTATQFFDLTSALATTETLHIDSVTITGTGASKFTRTSDTCDQATIQPGLTCRVTVKFRSADTVGALVPLTMTMRQGTSATTFARTVLLNGVVASTTPPPPSGGGSTDSGGGAIGGAWLAALALGIAALARRRG